MLWYRIAIHFGNPERGLRVSSHIGLVWHSEGEDGLGSIVGRVDAGVESQHAVRFRGASATVVVLKRATARPQEARRVYHCRQLQDVMALQCTRIIIQSLSAT